MKRFSKILTLILGLALAVTLFVISASASSDEYTLVVNFGGNINETVVAERPSYSEDGYFEYKNGDFRANYKITSATETDNSLTLVLDPNDVRYYAITYSDASVKYVTAADIASTDLGTAFIKDMNALPSGAELKLLSDVFYNGTSSISGTNKTIRLDVNGFNLIFVPYYNARTTVFSLTNADMYLYSSRPNGNVFHASPNASYNPATEVVTPNKAPIAFALFKVNANAKIYLGSYNGIDGNNLSTYTNILADIYNSYSEEEYAVSIDGGSYFRYTSGSMNSMFYLRDGGDGFINVKAKNATLNSSNTIFYSYNSNATPGTRRFNVDVENCVLAGGTAMVEEPEIDGRTIANFKNCYFLSFPGNFKNVNIQEGCFFSNPYENKLGEGLVCVSSFEKRAVELKTNIFAFDNHAFWKTTYDKGNPVYNITADFNLSSLDVTNTQETYYFVCRSVKEEDFCYITWVDEKGNSSTDRWIKGDIPRPSVPLPEGNDNYYYTYGTITPVDGDKTYVAMPVAKFGLKVNLTLADNLIYNVYIPESAIDTVKEVRIYDSLGQFSVLERGELATISNVPYYRYFFNIKSSKAADAFSFDMDIYTDESKTEYFTQKCEMSIPAYSAEILYNNKYSDNTHALMNKVLAYVKAACDYFKTSGENKYYGVIGKIPSVTEPVYREGVPATPITYTPLVDSILEGVRVNFGSQLEYRFYFESEDTLEEGETFVDFSTPELEVKISYVNNGGVNVVTVTDVNVIDDGDGKYFRVPLKASDMRSDVIITVNCKENFKEFSKGYTESFSYNLSNYISFVNSGSDENAKKLVYSLWEYSEAAGKFRTETPEVDVTINGTPIAEYKIVANTKEEVAAAKIFRDVIKEEYEIDLEILSSYDGKAIEFNSVSPESVYDYKVVVEGDNLVVNCAYRSFFVQGTVEFANNVFTSLNRDLNIGTDYNAEFSYGKLLYSDFDIPTYNGTAEDFKDLSLEELNRKVVENGAENAFYALKKAHAVANTKGYDVYGEPGKVYYISETLTPAGYADTITIKTNTYWQGAKFIIDDSNVSPTIDANLAGSHIFTVAKEANWGGGAVVPDDIKDGFSKDEITKFDLGLGYPAMVKVSNANATHFIRYTKSTGEYGDGKPQMEYIIIDAEGNIDPSTPFLFDYSAVTGIEVYRIDDEPIVVDGGKGCTITTLSSMIPLYGAYRSNTRDFSVSRPNTTIKNITHVIYNEPTEVGKYVKDKTDGHVYNGFFATAKSYNVEYIDCVAQSRLICVQGTYDISVGDSIDVRLTNFKQSNFYNEDGITPSTTKTWFVMGSNFCKNITYDGCMLTRFDAHCGVYNATIKNSVISSIRLTGGGHFLMENTTIVALRTTEEGFIELREDYGSTWNGTIELKDCTYKPVRTPTATLALVTSHWINHNFGYQTYLPNVIVDNLKIDSSANSTIKNIEIFNLKNASHDDDKNDPLDENGVKIPDFEENLLNQDYRQPILYNKDGTTKENVNPYIAPEFIIIKNNYAKKNYVAPTHIVFENTKFTVVPLPFEGLDTPVIDWFN